MQNEKNPRRSEKKEEPRRGTQQAGRSTRAIGNEGHSFSGLQNGSNGNATSMAIRSINRFSRVTA